MVVFFEIDYYWTMSDYLLEDSGLEPVIALLETLPLHKVMLLKSHIDLMVSNSTNLPTHISDEELFFISNLYKDKDKDIDNIKYIQCESS